ncbi:MAG TPA: ABC transporter permease, partial [Gemmatimonadaceae bacterium]|nr:ABC transporter permease [Gemmatimonadaceae bacterium]
MRRPLALSATVAAPVLALLAALVLGDLLIIVFGQSPAAVYRLLLEGTWGNAYGVGQVLYKATTLYCTGLAVALGVRAGLFNVGAESQLAFGGFLAALAGLWLPASAPYYLALPLALVAAAVGGAAVAALPGVLKARLGTSEVIVTIMLNFVVLAFLNWIVVARLG